MKDEELKTSETEEEVTSTTEETVTQSEESTDNVVEENVVSEEKKATDTNSVNEVKIEDVDTQSIKTVSDDFVSSKKGGNKGAFIIIGVIIVVLAGLLYFAYTNLFTTKKMFIKSINKGYSEFEEFIDDAIKENKTTSNKAMVVSQDLNINLEVNESLADENIKGIIDEINKLKIETEIGYDKKNKEMLMTLGALYDDKKLVDVGAYAKEENMYFELKDLYDKYIEVPLEDYESYFEEANIETEDLKYVLSTTKDAYINNLEEDEFKKSKATIKVENKDVKTTKITYNMSEKEGHELTQKALKKLIKDEKYLKALANISGKEKSEIKEELQESLDEITDEIESGDLETEKNLSFAVYTKGLVGKTVGYEITVDEEDSEEDGTISYYKGESKDQLKFVYNNEEMINATISDNKFVIEITSEGETVELQVTKKEKNKKTTYDYSISVDDSTISGSVIVEMIKEGKDGSYEAKITSSANVMGLASVTLTGTSKAEYKDSLEMPDVSNKISYTEVTEEDFNTIQSKLLENETLVQLITKITTYANNIE